MNKKNYCIKECNSPLDRKIVPGTLCVKFYLCANNKLNIISCPKGLAFSESKGKCEYSNLVKCSEVTSQNLFTTTKIGKNWLIFLNIKVNKLNINLKRM